MDSEINSKGTNELFRTVVQLRSVNEAKKFFRDLCTLSELKSMTERWQVVKLLQKGISYRNIAKTTGSSTATITRVAHWLHHGMGGYKLMLDRR